MKPHELELIEKYANGERHFSEANLRFASLSRADLRYANLSGTDFYRADLRYANLRAADFSGANLSGANLKDADLSRALLRAALLKDANLSGANLSGANLKDADLKDADLKDADLKDANLRAADFSGANLSGANLSGANLAWSRGNGKQICSAQMGKYNLVWTSEKLWIGFQSATFAEWWARTPEDIDRIESGAGKLWKEHMDFIRSMIERFPATPTNSKAPTER